MCDKEQGYAAASDTPASQVMREAFELEARARRLRRYEELTNKYGREIIELIELHYDIKMNNAKSTQIRRY